MTTLDLAKVLFPSLAGIAAFCYYLVHLADKGASDLAKQHIRKFASDRKLLPVVRSSFTFFVFASDRYFGRRLLSWRAFLRSIGLSLAWIFLVLVVCINVYPNYTSWLGNDLSRKLILKNAIVLLIVSLLIDYFSVCITRGLVRSALGKGKPFLILAVIIDLVISMFLFYCIFTGAKYFLFFGNAPLGPLASFQLWFSPGSLPITLQLLESFSLDRLVPQGNGVYDIQGGLLTEIVYAFPESILFFSSLLTSVWLWIYVLAYTFLFAAVRIDRAGVILRNYLKLESEPIHALALAIVAAFALLFAVILVIHALCHLI